MLGLAFLLTAAVGYGIYEIFDDDDENSGASEDEQNNTVDRTTFGPEDDLVVSEDYREFLEENENVSDEAIDMATFLTGPLNIDTGAGDDEVLGSASDDVIRAGDGDDIVNGSEGDDRVFLGNGNDTVQVGIRDLDPHEAGDDFIRGGAGNDTIIDDQGSNTLHGDVGRDFIDARDSIEDPGADTVTGGFGADTLLIDDGDTASGGAGSDFFDLWIDESDPGDAVVITDFDPDEDSLGIFIGRSDEEDSPEITLRHDENTNIASVNFNDVSVATLLNIDASTLTRISVNIVG
jgi:Ca2+-binding RTX toxin-like protein